MRIHLVRTGGSSEEKKRVVDIDTLTLTPWTREDIESLVNCCDFFNLPEQMPKTDWRQGIFEYRVIITEESRSHTVETAEQDAPDYLLSLIRRIERV